MQQPMKLMVEVSEGADPEKVAGAIEKLGIQVEGLHELDAVGLTFVLGEWEGSEFSEIKGKVECLDGVCGVDLNQTNYPATKKLGTKK